jgi:hypothetical protein
MKQPPKRKRAHKEEEFPRTFKGIWIPKALWFAPDLCVTEKCLLAEIDSLDDEVNGCFANNQYLADLFNLNLGRVANMLTDLRKKGWLDDLGTIGKKRFLRVNRNKLYSLKSEGSDTDQPSRKSEGSLHGKMKGASLKSEPDPSPHIDLENNRENTLGSSADAAPTTDTTAKDPGKGTEHNTFIDLWHESYFRQWDREYIFQGGKDGAAVKRLVLTKIPIEDLIGLAKWAWDHIELFNCNHSATIAGFSARINGIFQERDKTKGAKADHENVGWDRDKFFQQLHASTP